MKGGAENRDLSLPSRSAVSRTSVIRRVAIAGARFSGPVLEAGVSPRADVLVRDGVIEWIGANGTAQLDSTDDPVEVDDGDLVALPALVEPHAHLDKALTASIFADGERDLPSAIKAWVGRSAGHEDA